MPLADGPFVLSVAGDAYPHACRILAVIWEGATTAGDTVTLNSIATGGVLWPGRANDTNTYLGANFGPEGIPCQSGFRLSQISNGTLYVYIREA